MYCILPSHLRLLIQYVYCVATYIIGQNIFFENMLISYKTSFSWFALKTSYFVDFMFEIIGPNRFVRTKLRACSIGNLHNFVYHIFH